MVRSGQVGRAVKPGGHGLGCSRADPGTGWSVDGRRRAGGEGADRPRLDARPGRGGPPGATAGIVDRGCHDGLRWGRPEVGASLGGPLGRGPPGRGPPGRGPPGRGTPVGTRGECGTRRPGRGDCPWQGRAAAPKARHVSRETPPASHLTDGRQLGCYPRDVEVRAPDALDRRGGDGGPRPRTTPRCGLTPGRLAGEHRWCRRRPRRPGRSGRPQVIHRHAGARRRARFRANPRIYARRFT